MSAPTLTVELLTSADVWEDVTDSVRSLSISRGQRSRSFDAFRAGHAQIVFDNRLREFDPSNGDAALDGELVPGREVRISGAPTADTQLTWSEFGSTYASWTALSGTTWEVSPDTSSRVVFTGCVESWSVQWRGNADSTSTAVVTDGLATLAARRAATTTAVGAGETTAARVSRVLDLDEVDWPATARDIGSGSVTVGGFIGGENVAAYLQDVAGSESGALFAARDGDVTFIGRLNAPSTSALSFSDDRTEADRAHYVDAELTSDSSLLFNRVVVTGDDHATVTAEDTASQAAYGIRALERTSLLDNVTDAQTLADTLLARFSEPELRFQSLSLLVGDQVTQQQGDLLDLELFDVVTVERNPPGVGDPVLITQIARVDALRLDVRPGSPWRLQVALSSGTKQIFFVLDSDEFGVLDDDRLA